MSGFTPFQELSFSSETFPKIKTFPKTFPEIISLTMYCFDDYGIKFKQLTTKQLIFETYYE